MKIGVYLLSLAALFLAACGGDSGTDSGKEASESKIQYESFGDLPNCTGAREGEIVEILNDGESYVCKDKKWEEYVDTEIKSYATEDDMPNCSAKNKGTLALVEEDSVVQVCKNSRWETLGYPYANEDSLPNCTKKRDGEKAYLMEEDEVQVCEEGVWNTLKNESDSGFESDDEGNEEDDGSGKEQTTETKENNDNDSDSGSETKSSSSGAKDSSSSKKSSASMAPGVKEGTFTDSRDGQKYKTVKIGNQEWFAQNLDYDDGSGSICPLLMASYCEKYGRLYRKSSVERCPTGWRTPSILDWEALFVYVDNNNGKEGVGKSLKATSGWYEAGYIDAENVNGSKRVAVATGDDLFRFSALPAGSCWDGMCYSDDDARFWAVEGDGYKISYDSDLFELDEDVKFGDTYISIRCIKDEKSSSSVTESSSSSMTSGSSVGTSSVTVSSSSATESVSNYGTCAPAVTTAYLEDSVSWSFARGSNFSLTQYANASYQWNFPNGTSKSSTSRTPKSTYTEIGTYGASVIINGDTDNTITCSPKVKVVGNKITCSCTHTGENSINVTDGPVDVTWTANCTSNADITSYYWNGSTVNGDNTYVHAVSEGVYTPTLKVKNSQGVEISASCGGVEGWAEAENVVNLIKGQSVILGSGKDYIVTASSCGWLSLKPERGATLSGYVESDLGETYSISNLYYYEFAGVASNCSGGVCFSGIIYLNEGRAELECI